jgi:hypothetical protein
MNDTHQAARRDLIRTTAPVIAALVLALAGCGVTTASGGRSPSAGPQQTAQQPTRNGTAPGPDVDPTRKAEVYISVLRRYLGTELSVGGPDDVGTVYVLTRAGRDDGAIGPRVQQAVGAALDSSYRIRWVNSAESVEISGRGCDPAGKRDVLITLGPVPAGTQIRLTLDGRSDCGLAGGWVYRLSAEEGSWTVTGRRASWMT